MFSPLKLDMQIKHFLKTYLPRNDNAVSPKAQHVMCKNNSEKHD